MSSEKSKVLHILLFVLITSCNTNEKSKSSGKNSSTDLKAKIDSVYKGWKDVKGENITFKLPSNWLVKEIHNSGATIFQLKPDFMKDAEDFYIYEIIELDSRGASFEDAVAESITYYQHKFSTTAQIVNNNDFNFKGLTAKKIELNIGNTDSIPVEGYVIKGDNKFYIFSYYKMKENDTELNKLTIHILNSILIYGS